MMACCKVLGVSMLREYSKRLPSPERREFEYGSAGESRHCRIVFLTKLFGSRARLRSSFNHVLVALDVFGFIVRFNPAFVAFVGIGVTDSRRTSRRIMEDSLPRFTVRTSYDKVPFEGLAGGQQHREKLAKFL